MRALFLLSAVLALGACANNDQHDNTQNIDENVTAENIVSNDVTAIDAVTGEAANMAADAGLNAFAETSNSASDNGAVAKPSARKPRTPATTEPASNSSSAPETNAAE